MNYEPEVWLEILKAQRKELVRIQERSTPGYQGVRTNENEPIAYHLYEIEIIKMNAEIKVLSAMLGLPAKGTK